jgi:hypothetical protein
MRLEADNHPRRRNREFRGSQPRPTVGRGSTALKSLPTLLGAHLVEHTIKVGAHLREEFFVSAMKMVTFSNITQN